MDFLNYIKLNNQKNPADPQTPGISVAIVSNFTDEVLAKVLRGVCLHNSVEAEIYNAPYKQYAFLLKDKSSRLWQQPAQLTFFFFDLNFYIHSEFSESLDYGEGLINDLKAYADAVPGTIVVNTFLLPYIGPRGNHVINHDLFSTVLKLNEKLFELAKNYSNVRVFDINRLAFAKGEENIRDLRGLYAFDTPFTNDFLTVVAEEWFVYIRSLAGKTKKIIVVDLDNTLWGGVVGELGPLGIALGQGYPGLAFQNFQRALLEYNNSGVLLAINSKNNPEDVDEVFEKNPHMVLQKKHFASVRANWGDKTENLKSLANELNLGLDSFVFLDDDPFQREMVKANLPEVLVPDLSVPPEQFINILYGLSVFNPHPLTAEDADKNKQYRDENLRKNLQSVAANLEDFILNLGMSMDISLNNKQHLPRISQLTLKTNQFNATTRRYAEKETENLMAKGWVFNAGLKDKFGDYGLTAVSIVIPKEGDLAAAMLDTFLMSCRILGRGVEFAFLDFIVRDLYNTKGVKVLFAEFISTLKNGPARDFFTEFGFQLVEQTEQGSFLYRLDCEQYCAVKNPKVYSSITINY